MPLACIRVAPDKQLSDLYHPHELAPNHARVRASVLMPFSPWSDLMLPDKPDPLTCVLVVTAALLLGFVRCSGNLNRAP